jgi:hypothetical protein
VQRRPVWPIILAFAAVKFAVNLYASGHYGYFRDELYFIACGRHLDWGYVDHPPLVALYARLGELLGPSLRGFRLLVTISGTLRVVLTGVIAARLGGGRAAQALACTAVLLAPIYLASDTIMTMNSVEHVFWLACLLIVIEIANGASEKWWLAFGVLAGLGLQNKHSMLFLGACVVAAMLLTPLRGSFARPWIWIGGAIAALIFLPNVVWEIRHDWATLELLRNVKNTGKNVVLAPVPFVAQQAMMLDPFAAPLWIAGVIWLFTRREHRFLGWTYVILLVLMIKLEAKDYYLAGIYPALFAAGAVVMTKKKIAAIAMAVLVVAGGAIAIPLALPILPPDRYLAYQRSLGVKPRAAEVSHTSEMPQIFADQFGWEEMVRQVAAYYNSLPAEERKKTAIYTGNYGEAGAIDFYGPKYGLPPAISGHQNYFLWGPRGYTGESVILIEWESGGEWTSLRQIARRYHPYAMPDENGPIWHGRGLKTPIAQIWPGVKHWR